MLCPGSRSGPLATAAGLLAERAALELITAIDERSAAFLALGLATGSGRAVAVVTTSGTAVANLLPAVVEADRSTQPLLLLTADRPRRLKNRGANQTVNQEEFLLSACRRVMTPSSRWPAWLGGLRTFGVRHGRLELGPRSYGWAGAAESGVRGATAREP